MEGASFGAGRAGGAIDPVDFLKQPQTLLRVTTWVRRRGRGGRRCPGRAGDGQCPGHGAVPGALGSARCFGQCPVFWAVLALFLPGFLAFLWFVAFCFLANQWQRTTMSRGALQGADAARAAITFSFFSIIIWVVLAVRALQRYRLGTDMSLFATDQFAPDPNAAYPGYPTGSGIESTDTYQSPPFTETLDTNPKGYQVPAY
ncbi:SNG3 protein, partial [Centropus unirufus]|nr:SNG3 protein [Centropus unirufus]